MQQNAEENLPAAKADGKCPKEKAGLRYCSVHAVVGERSIRGEVRAEALVDCMEVRMPE